MHLLKCYAIFFSLGLSLAHCFRFLLLYCVCVCVCCVCVRVFFLRKHLSSHHFRMTSLLKNKADKKWSTHFWTATNIYPPQKCLSTLLTSKVFSPCFGFCFYFCCSNLCNFLWTIFIKGEVHSKLTKRRDYKKNDVKNGCGQLVFILA